MNDWLSLLVTILLVNSIQVMSLDLIFSIDVNYMRYLLIQVLLLFFIRCFYFYLII